jgi:hypothetical protein
MGRAGRSSGRCYAVGQRRVQVNPDTITLAGARVRMIGKANAAQCHAEDVNRDGLPDLVCHVETAESNRSGV